MKRHRKEHSGDLTPEVLPLVLKLRPHIARTKDPDYLGLKGRANGVIYTTLAAEEFSRRVLLLRVNFAVQLTDHTLNATAVSLCDKILEL